MLINLRRVPIQYPVVFFRMRIKQRRLFHPRQLKKFVPSTTEFAGQGITCLSGYE